MLVMPRPLGRIEDQTPLFAAAKSTLWQKGINYESQWVGNPCIPEADRSLGEGWPKHACYPDFLKAIRVRKTRSLQQIGRTGARQTITLDCFSQNLVRNN